MNKLTVLRKTARLTQEELAERAKTNRVYVSLIEGGRRNPTEEELKRIAKALRFMGDPTELLQEVTL